MKPLKTDIFEGTEAYKDLFDHAHDLIHIVEPDGRILYVNKTWGSLLGYEQEQIEGKSIYSFIDIEDQNRFIAYRENVLKGITNDQEIVVRFVTKSGDRIFLEGFVSAKFLEGKAIYTRGIFRDVTLKLQNEAELRERESNLQHLLFYAPDAIIVIDSRSYITFWNPKAETIFGWSSAEVLGKQLSEVIVPQQYREAHNKGMDRYLSTGEARVLNKTIELTALNKEGKEFFISLTISITHQRGAPAFIAFIRDIDEQKRNAMELEQKKVQLEISNNELEQFAHVASHDMKEPIRKISIFADQMKEDTANILSDKSKTSLEKIKRAAARLTIMVDGILTYSSLKGEELTNDTVDLNEVIREVESDLELIIQQKKALIKCSDLPLVKGAAFLLYQLFYNLINNALKFSKTDQALVIEISANALSVQELENYPVDPTLPYFEIAVKDNGIGFQQEAVETIFKTFARLHSKDQYEGTGLGLSLCRNIVEKHKGFITAYGEEGVGATFMILLPALVNN